MPSTRNLKSHPVHFTSWSYFAPIQDGKFLIAKLMYILFDNITIIFCTLYRESELKFNCQELESRVTRLQEEFYCANKMKDEAIEQKTNVETK